MAETMLDLRERPKPEAYAELETHLRAVLEGVTDEVAAMATFAAVIHHGFGHLWTGFYRVVPPGDLLRVGPYQGTLGCLEIPFGKGVCGTSAARRETVVVPDVHAFPGHITCDGRSRSEIVVPVFGRATSANATPTLIAVLDIDSAEPARFDDEDREGLERLVRCFAEAG